MVKGKPISEVNVGRLADSGGMPTDFNEAISIKRTLYSNKDTLLPLVLAADYQTIVINPYGRIPNSQRPCLYR